MRIWGACSSPPAKRLSQQSNATSGAYTDAVEGAPPREVAYPPQRFALPQGNLSVVLPDGETIVHVQVTTEGKQR
jgi:hypothetical protein